MPGEQRLQNTYALNACMCWRLYAKAGIDWLGDGLGRGLRQDVVDELRICDLLQPNASFRFLERDCNTESVSLFAFCWEAMSGEVIVSANSEIATLCATHPVVMAPCFSCDADVRTVCLLVDRGS